MAITINIIFTSHSLTHSLNHARTHSLTHQCKCIDPKNLGVPPSCGAVKYKGDFICDDDNNNKACAWDGGDCCYKSVGDRFNPGLAVQTKYCTQVDDDEGDSEW